MAKHYPFKNLAFQGGGVKTLAYQGALTVLEAQGILPQIKRVAGTSAGAVAATLVSFRLSVQETNALFNSIDFADIPTLKSAKDLSWQPHRLIEPQVDRVVSNFDAVRRLVYKFGWYANKTSYQWLQDTIATQCDGNGRSTFGEFRERGFRDLHIVATNLSTKSVETFCASSTPDMAVADALLISQAIPLYFEAIQFDGQQIGAGDYYVDGGILHNFPIHVFDHPPFDASNEWFINSVNWETLGIRTFTPTDCSGAKRPINNLAGYMSHLMEAMIDQQDVMFDYNHTDRWRTINISNHCVSSTQFDIQSHEGGEAYQKLIHSGQEAAQTYLEKYNSPAPNQLAKIKRIMGKLWPL